MKFFILILGVVFGQRCGHHCKRKFVCWMPKNFRVAQVDLPSSIARITVDSVKKAKLLERKLNSSGSQENNNIMAQKSTVASKGVSSQIAYKGSEFIEVGEGIINSMNIGKARKSRLMILKELVNLKKKALALIREGKLNEAVEELRKGATIEHQHEKMYKAQNLDGEGLEGQVTDSDLSDPSFLSILRDLGWNDGDDELPHSSIKPSKKYGDEEESDAGSRSTKEEPVKKAANSSVVDEESEPSSKRREILKEILVLKMKALALRRRGEVEEAEEVWRMAWKAKMEDIENQNKEFLLHVSNLEKPGFPASTELYGKRGSPGAAMEDNDSPSSVGGGPISKKAASPSNENVGSTSANHSMNSSDLFSCDSRGSSSDIFAQKLTEESICSVLDSSGFSSEASRSKREILKEILASNRKALALKREEVEEAEEVGGCQIV